MTNEERWANYEKAYAEAMALLAKWHDQMTREFFDSIATKPPPR